MKENGALLWVIQWIASPHEKLPQLIPLRVRPADTGYVWVGLAI
jgi:hypothetical protein